MNPHIAMLLCVLGILGLFKLDRDPLARTSKALWLPVMWLSIAGSRMVSQWLALTGVTDPTARVNAATRYMDGSPLDRLFLTVSFIVALVVLAARGRRVVQILRDNPAILFFVLYCGASTLWSDYPDVTFKRWIKSVSDLSMVLIVLTERDRWSAVKRLLTRTGFILIPVSILLIKYYPILGRGYSEWGESALTGVATSKNELGGVCLLFGVASFWQITQLLRGARGARLGRPLIAHCVLLTMAVWLLWTSSAMTAMSCFAMAAVLIIASTRRAFVRRPGLMHVLVLSIVSVACVALFLEFGSGLVQQLGRDPTLTGRTDIWKLVLSMERNPLLGTGFESFWLGSRLDKIWNIYWWHPNEAHNGYIEVYLNLGCMGLVLLAVLFVSGYRNAMSALRRDPNTGNIRLAYFVVTVVYNFTESAVRIMHPVWIVFLLATAKVREEAPGEKTNVIAPQPALQQEEFSYS